MEASQACTVPSTLVLLMACAIRRVSWLERYDGLHGKHFGVTRKESRIPACPRLEMKTLQQSNEAAVKQILGSWLLACLFPPRDVVGFLMP